MTYEPTANYFADELLARAVLTSWAPHPGQSVYQFRLRFLSLRLHPDPTLKWKYNGFRMEPRLEP